MSKIICDVCGTSYPETSTQCPICGCVRSGDAVAVAGAAGDLTAKKPSSYAYVKGGRFSKTNVKKRNAGVPLENAEPTQKAQPRSTGTQSESAQSVNPKPTAHDEQNRTVHNGVLQGSAAQSSATQSGSTNIRGQSSLTPMGKTKPVQNQPKPPARREPTRRNNSRKTEAGLAIAIVVLLLAITGVAIYIVCNYLLLDGGKKNQNDLNASQSTLSADSSEKITGIKLAVGKYELKSMGATFLLSVDTVPAGQKINIKDIKFESDDPTIATVDNTGNVVATGRGSTKIKVTWGEFSAECEIFCNFDMPNQGDTTEPTNPNTGPAYKKSELTFVDYGYGYEATFPMNWVSRKLYNGKIPAELVEFSSNDESVATVDEEGVVTFVGIGRALITAKYNGWEIVFKCFVSE